MLRQLRGAPTSAAPSLTLPSASIAVEHPSSGAACRDPPVDGAPAAHLLVVADIFLDDRLGFLALALPLTLALTLPLAVLLLLAFLLLHGFGEPHVEVAADDRLEIGRLVLEEVVGARDDLVVDLDAALRLELTAQLRDRRRGHDTILIAVQHQARGGAGRQEREIVKVRR